ncbi:MAG: hypothetical protein Ct9H300mP19_16640 [Dehalococcoidia bacterium]|nr:MAG: hypothetical protein Ct9H300mP19_16640 [Dehalococcoidia bacterium]
MRGEVPENEDLPGNELVVPFGQAQMVREGTDCTMLGLLAV